MLDLELTTPPTAQLVTLAELRAQLNVDADDTSTNDILTGYLATALSHLDGWSGILGRAICPQTWTLYLERFPWGSIRLPLPPLVSVDAITYLDTAGVTQTVSASAYEVLAGERAEIALAYNQAWPVARCHPRSIAVTFTCGFTPTGQAPNLVWPQKAEKIRLAVKMIVAALYEQREDWAQLPGLDRALAGIALPRT